MERPRGNNLAMAILTLLLLLLTFGVSSSLANEQQEENSIRVVTAERRIDLTSSTARVYLTLKVENTGISEASEILLAFPPSELERLAIVKASIVEGKRKKKNYVPLSVNPSDQVDLPNGARLFSIALRNSLKAGGIATVEVLYVLTNCLEPFPAEISQSDTQLVYYRDSATLLSPYHVLEQVTYIKTPSNRVESFTRVNPSTRAGTELKYGSYDSRPSYTYVPIIIHFENNHPFAIVKELVRKVEISHWGNVQITEHYNLRHAGARHKGVFSRLEYQSKPSISGISSFRHLLARLPPRVHSVYYRDEIGNISSSHLRVDSQKGELEIEPRYPLFGGWHTTFIIGYVLPLEDFLFESENGRRYLNLSFGCPLQDTVVEELTIKIVLPEGSKNPEATVPFIVGHHLETTYSYLDVVGRTSVVLTKKNVVADHNVPFQVYYDFSPIFMLAEPFMLVAVVFLFFIACVAYLHVDLSIKTL